MCQLDKTCHVAAAVRVLPRWPLLGVLRVVLRVIVLPRRPQPHPRSCRRRRQRRPRRWRRASSSSTVPSISKHSKSSLSFHRCIDLMLLPMLILLLRPSPLPFRYDYSFDLPRASLLFVHGYATTTITSRSRRGWSVNRRSSFSKYNVGREPLRLFGVDKTQYRRLVRLDASRDFDDDDDDDDNVAKTDATPSGDAAARTTNAATVAGTTAPPRRRVVVPSTTSSQTARQRPYWEGNDIADDDDDDDFDYLDDDTAATATAGAFNLVDNDVSEWEKCLVSVPNIDRRRRSSDSRRRNNIADPESSSSTSMTTSTCWVLLPPPSVALPTAIVHFVGGTVTGSAPHVWYDTLLTDIVRQSNCAVVASTIPVTTGLLDGGQSPLDHVRLALLLQQQFCTAYETILVDEYGDGLDKLNDSSRGADGTATALLQNVPICGLGHSLGARLLVVLATLQDPQSAKATNERVAASFDINYKALMLMSFTNFGAGVGIPGLAQLYRASRRLENDEQKTRVPRPRDPNRRNVKDNTNGYYDNRNDEDNYDDDDVMLSDLWNDLTTRLQQGAARVQSTLTPSTEALEFFPSPEQLWKAIEVDGRYTNVIRQTLVVQFDNDDVDQSSRLATAIVQGSQNGDANESTMASNVKFARLRGTHLTPISFANSDNNSRRGYGKSGSWFQSVNDQAGRLLLKLLQSNGSKQRGQQAEALLELRQSIVRYIIEIVAKD